MAEPLDMYNPKHYEPVRKSAEKAVPLPNWCYTSSAFYQREVQRIFMKAWNYVGHASQITDPGDFYCHDITGMPIIIIRGDDGEVRAFHNSCRHRGSLIATGEGTCKSLVCPYHSWTYGRNGGLIATPLIDEDDHLCHADLGLLPVRLERWAGFLFVNFDDEAVPLMKWLGELPEKCASYTPETLVSTRRKVYPHVKANWKLHLENFNDSLHIPFVHGGSLARQNVAGRKRASHHEFDGECIDHFTEHKGSRSLMDGAPGFPPISTLQGRYREGTYYPCILPTMMMGWTIDCVYIFEIHPTGPESMRIVSAMLFPEEVTSRDDFEELAKGYYHRQDIVLPEDNAAVEMQQRGLHAPVTASARFTHLETLSHAFDNWLLDQVL